MNCYSNIGSEFDRTSIRLVFKHNPNLLRASHSVADRTGAEVRGDGVGPSPVLQDGSQD
ncbi:MAG TPA: hypothetical protein VLA84_15555 [Microcoleus sp.]|nr:hypothetical protein [Microcoleus sp.]